MSVEFVILNVHNNSHWYQLNFENVTQFVLLNLTVTAIIIVLTVFYIHQISRVVPVLLSPVIKNRVRVKVIYVCYTNKICLYQSYGVKCHFQKYFSYIVAVSFVDGGNQSNQRKPPTSHKLLTNFITYCCN